MGIFGSVFERFGEEYPVSTNEQGIAVRSIVLDLTEIISIWEAEEGTKTIVELSTGRIITLQIGFEVFYELLHMYGIFKNDVHHPKPK